MNVFIFIVYRNGNIVNRARIKNGAGAKLLRARDFFHVCCFEIMIALQEEKKLRRSGAFVIINACVTESTPRNADIAGLSDVSELDLMSTCCLPIAAQGYG